MTETRLAETVDHTMRPAGRSTATIRCPFCGCSVEARLWSLAGSGKRCDCGAVLSGKGLGLTVATRKSGASEDGSDG